MKKTNLEEAVQLAQQISSLSEGLRNSELNEKQARIIQAAVNRYNAVQRKKHGQFADSHEYFVELREEAEHVHNLLSLTYGTKDKMPETFRIAYEGADAILRNHGITPSVHPNQLEARAEYFTDLGALASVLGAVKEAAIDRNVPEFNAYFEGELVYHDNEQINALPGAEHLPRKTKIAANFSEQGLEIDYTRTLAESRGTKVSSKSLADKVQNFVSLSETKEYITGVADELDSVIGEGNE